MARRTGISRVGERKGRKVTLYLDDTTIQAAKDRGRGNMSEGIRLALAEPSVTIEYQEDGVTPREITLANGESYVV